MRRPADGWGRALYIGGELVFGKGSKFQGVIIRSRHKQFDEKYCWDTVKALDVIQKGMKKAQDDALDTIIKKERSADATSDEDVEVSDSEQIKERMEKKYISNVYCRPLESLLAETPHSNSEQEKIMCTVLDYLRNEQEALRNYGRIYSLVERL